MEISQRPVFIVDGMNAYLRAYASFPQMSSHGYQMGGCIGFLKTLQRLCREFRPISVCVTWEGGGSRRRRKLFPEYKMNRKPEKLNRFYDDDIPDTDENRRHQLLTLIGILKFVPVCQIYVSDCEGDDVVSYLCRGPFRSKDKVIVSSDKDMYQLLDDKTDIYSLYKKRFVTQTDLFEEFRIKSQNFAIAKCLCGDPSDNIPGVKGVGFKTVAKKFPMLGGDDTVILQDILDYAASHRHENTVYKRISESHDDIRRNWQLVHLDGSMLSHEQTKRVDNTLNTFRPVVDKMSFVKTLIKEGIVDFDLNGFFYDLSCIEGLHFASENQ
jgi:5'-3' exonuclease